MFTPGRCKKTGSPFCAPEAVWGVTAPGATWGETPAAIEGGLSGEGTTDAPGDGSGTVGARCAGVSDDDSTRVGDDGSGTLAAASTGVSDDDCTAIGADSAGPLAPGEAKKKYVSAAKPNVAMIAVPAISGPRTPNVSEGLLGSKGWKGSSPLTGRIVSTRRRSPASVVSFGARGGAQSSTGGSVRSAKLISLGRTSVMSTPAMLPPDFSPAISPCRIEEGPALHRLKHGLKHGDRTTAERHECSIAAFFPWCVSFWFCSIRLQRALSSPVIPPRSPNEYQDAFPISRRRVG
jgi:hypothetical protein